MCLHGWAEAFSVQSVGQATFFGCGKVGSSCPTHCSATSALRRFVRSDLSGGRGQVAAPMRARETGSAVENGETYRRQNQQPSKLLGFKVPRMNAGENPAPPTRRPRRQPPAQHLLQPSGGASSLAPENTRVKPHILEDPSRVRRDHRVIVEVHGTKEDTVLPAASPPEEKADTNIPVVSAARIILYRARLLAARNHWHL